MARNSIMSSIYLKVKFIVNLEIVWGNLFFFLNLRSLLKYKKCCFFPQSYPVPSIGDEDFDIPPITPPSMLDHSLLHLTDTDSGYHSLCHSMPQNGILQFNPQNMNLPAITVSNMLSQDGALLSNCLSVVRTSFIIFLIMKLVVPQVIGNLSLTFIAVYCHYISILIYV